ncbi:hypothetical protein EON67_11185, partial [archaeon]
MSASTRAVARALRAPGVRGCAVHARPGTRVWLPAAALLRRSPAAPFSSATAAVEADPEVDDVHADDAAEVDHLVLPASLNPYKDMTCRGTRRAR